MTAIDISKLARAEDVRIVEYKGENFNITVDGTSQLRKRIAQDHEMRIARMACSYMLDSGLYDVEACIEYVIRREQE